MGIWTKYIEFETLRNNLIVVNLLCYMALEVPSKRSVLDKYQVLIGTLYDDIVK